MNTYNLFTYQATDFTTGMFYVVTLIKRVDIFVVGTTFSYAKIDLVNGLLILGNYENKQEHKFQLVINGVYIKEKKKEQKKFIVDGVCY